MKGSIERVRAFLRGDHVDRPPIYELLRNDAVIAHFAGEAPTPENAAEVVYRAYEPALDATRPMVRLPEHERSERLPDGRERRYFRWTVWTDHVRYADTGAWAAAKRADIDRFGDGWDDERAAGMAADLAAIARHRERLDDVFFFPGSRSVGLMEVIGEVGLEFFSWCLADVPEIVDELLEVRTRATLAWISHLPEGHGIEAVFCGDDIAYKAGPLLPPSWFAEHYFERLARVCDAYHRRGIKVLFHSDGNLMPGARRARRGGHRRAESPRDAGRHGCGGHPPSPPAPVHGGGHRRVAAAAVRHAAGGARRGAPDHRRRRRADHDRVIHGA